MKPKPLKEATFPLSDALHAHLNALVPGRVYRLTASKDRQFAVLNWDDLEHILTKCHMHTRADGEV